MTSSGPRSASASFATYSEVQDAFDEAGWTDGLPIVPPIPSLVEEALATVGIDPDLVVGDFPQRRRTVTAEQVATNAIMAGCKPAYFPVVLAAWECLASPEYDANMCTVSTSGGAPLVVINGPVIRLLGLRSGTNAFGPGNRANATIGRAIRLMLINLVGATPEFDRASLGHPGKYAFCIAEDEDSFWEPLHVQRGCMRNDSAVTVVHVEGPQHVRESVTSDPECLLMNFVDHVRIWNQGGCGVIVFNSEHRELLQRNGWSKRDVASFLFENSWRSLAELKRFGRVPAASEAGDVNERRWTARGPDDFLIVGAGGTGPFSAVVPPWADAVSTSPVTRIVKVA